MHHTLPCRVNPADLTIEEWDSVHPRYAEAARRLSTGHLLAALDEEGTLLGALSMGVGPCPLAACPEAVITGVSLPCAIDLGTALYEEAAALARSLGCARLLFPVETGIGLNDALRLGLDPCNEIGMCYALALDPDLLPEMEWADEVDGFVL